MHEFLIDSIIKLGWHEFQHTVRVPMGTNCAPLLADFYSYSYEAEFYQNFKEIKKGAKGLVKKLNFTFGYIGVLSITNTQMIKSTHHVSIWTWVQK